jgi:hypothetical protein
MQQLQSGDLEPCHLRIAYSISEIVCDELLRERLLAVSECHVLSDTNPLDLHDLARKRLYCLRQDVMVSCTCANTQLHSVFETHQHAIMWKSAQGCSDAARQRTPKHNIPPRSIDFTIWRQNTCLKFETFSFYIRSHSSRDLERNASFFCVAFRSARVHLLNRE